MKRIKFFAFLAISMLFSTQAMQKGSQAPQPSQPVFPEALAEIMDDTQPVIPLEKLYFMVLFKNAYETARNNPNFQSLLQKIKENKFQEKEKNALAKLQLTRKEFFAGLLTHVRRADASHYDPRSTSVTVRLFGADIPATGTQMTFHPSLKNPTQIHITAYQDLLNLNIKDMTMNEQLGKVRNLNSITDYYEILLGQRHRDPLNEEPEDFGCAFGVQ